MNTAWAGKPVTELLIAFRRSPFSFLGLLALISLLSPCGCSRTSKQPAKTKSREQLISEATTAPEAKTRIAAIRQLPTLGKDAVLALVDALRDPINPVCFAAAEALGESKDPDAVEPLCAMLRSGGRSIRPAVVSALAKLRDPRAIPPLLAALPSARPEISSALLGFGDPAIPALIEALADSDARVSAAEILATMGPSSVVPLTEVLRSSGNKYARLGAARALGEINDPRAIAAMDEALVNADDRLTAAAYRFLIRQGRPGTEAGLIRAFRALGRIPMAEDFARCGNPELKAAADEWARKMEYDLVPARKGVAVLKWGGTVIPSTQVALFHFDDALTSTSGTAPDKSNGITYVPGRFGNAVTVTPKGILSYARSGLLDMNNASIEMWISPREDGTNPVYTKYNHALLLYKSSKNDQFLISEGTFGGFYAGSVIRGDFKGAGGSRVSAWKAGEWHHIAFTCSARENRQRLYVDGNLIHDHPGALPMPELDLATFTLVSDFYGNWTAFALDELRISSDEKSPDAIRYDSARRSPFVDNEVFRSILGMF